MPPNLSPARNFGPSSPVQDDHDLVVVQEVVVAYDERGGAHRHQTSSGITPSDAQT